MEGDSDQFRWTEGQHRQSLRVTLPAIKDDFTCV